MKCWVFAKTGMAQLLGFHQQGGQPELGTTGVEKSLDSRLIRFNGIHLKNVWRNRGRKFESWSHLGGNHSWDGHQCHPPRLMTPDGSPILRSKSISVGYINYGTSPFLMGKSTISMAIFNSFLYVYQRVTARKTLDFPLISLSKSMFPSSSHIQGT